MVCCLDEMKRSKWSNVHKHCVSDELPWNNTIQTVFALCTCFFFLAALYPKVCGEL